jgi:hypothetical protein
MPKISDAAGAASKTMPITNGNIFMAANSPR